MLFNSYAYFFLVLITFALYYLKWLKPFQTHLLIIASFIFYSYTNPWLLSLLAFSILLNAIISFQIAKDLKRRAKLWATIGVIANLGVLIFFKYTPLIANSIATNWRSDEGIGHFLAQIPLPIGISFFTFQGISLLIDVYREETATYKPLVLIGALDNQHYIAK
jgi:alginate O-acetyltransferase complex protein AlgI